MTKELKNRIITSCVLILLLLSCLYINNYSWLSLLTIVSLISLYEIIVIGKRIFKDNLNFFLFSLISCIYFITFVFTAYKSTLIFNELGILFILSVCMLSDIGGYIIGKFIGAKKLTKISPNKTISGSFGSFLFSLLPLIFASKIFSNSVLIIFMFCLIISLICQLGDLFISYLKRLANVKDTGKFLPGHGGLLDRVDGLIFVIPIIYLYTII